MPRAHRMLTAALAVVLSGLALSACSDDADEARSTSTPPAVDTTTDADCAALIPSTVASDLGWQEKGFPALDLGLCTQDFDGGELSAGQATVGGASSADLPENGKDRFDELCAQLSRGTVDLRDAEPVDWLGDQATGCAVTSDDGAGPSVLLVLTPAGVVVRAEVSPAEPTDPSAVQTALTALAQNAVDQAS